MTYRTIGPLYWAHIHSPPAAIMSILTGSEPNFSSIDAAKQLQLTFDSAHLRIRDVQARFHSRTPETSDDATGRRGSGSISNTPDSLAAEVLDYMVCLDFPIMSFVLTIMCSLLCTG